MGYKKQPANNNGFFLRLFYCLRVGFVWVKRMWSY